MYGARYPTPRPSRAPSGADTKGGGAGYRRALRRALASTGLRTSATVEGEELQRHATAFIDRLKRDNDWAGLRQSHMIEPASIFVADHDQAWQLHPDQGLQIGRAHV